MILFCFFFFFFFNFNFNIYIYIFLSLFCFLNVLQTRQPGSFLTELKQKLLLPPSEAVSAGTRYNVPLINSLVLYVGMQVLNFFLLIFVYFSKS